MVQPPSWLEHIPFAFWIIEALRPSVLVELGTHSGNSYAAFAQAIQSLGLATSAYAIDTWQGDPQAGFYGEQVFAEWSLYHNAHFSSFSRLVRSTFDDALTHFSDGSVDLLHIDGWHTFEAASQDVARWRPKLSRRAVVLMHDINVRERDFGTWRLWERLRLEYPSFGFLHGHGLGVLGVGPDLSEPLQWLLSRTDDDDVTVIRQFFAQLGGAVAARFAQREIDAQLSGAGFAGQTVTAALGQAEARVQEFRSSIERLQAEIIARDAAIEAERAALAAAQHERETARVTLAREHEGALNHWRERADEQAERAARLQERLVTLSQLPRPLSSPAVSATPAAITHQRSVDGHRLVRGLRLAARFPPALGIVPVANQRYGLAAWRLLAQPRRLKEAWVIHASGLFDDSYYRQRNADLKGSRLTPLMHFILKGAAEDRNPHPLFDVGYYLRANPDVAAADTNPLSHYCTHVVAEPRRPHPLFDTAFYFHQNPDVRQQQIEPLRHFLRDGAREGRNPNPFFDCAYYLAQAPDVAAEGSNPLVHYALNGWREGRRPSAGFDPLFYRAQNPDVPVTIDPLVHYLECGRHEQRQPVGEDPGHESRVSPLSMPAIRLQTTGVGSAPATPPALLCVSHVWPVHPRAGNEYRVQHLLRWFQQQGHRVIAVISPLPGEPSPPSALADTAAEFGNAVLCHRDGRIEYALRDIPDVLASLNGSDSFPFAVTLDEERPMSAAAQRLLDIDRTFCHDALIATVLRLGQALGPHILLTEYIWMSRLLPLTSPQATKVIDTIDVFSTKRDKVLQFGIDDLHVEPEEEARRLAGADLIIAIQDEERRELQRLMPGKTVLTAGVDLNVLPQSGHPVGRRALLVASDNPMNRKGLHDFLRFAWPYVHDAVPDAELVVAGRVCAMLTGDIPGVVRLGVVDDLEPLYAECRLVINPAVAGTGLKIKTLEALAHLRTVVTWPSGVDGLSADLASLCVLVEDWYAFSHRLAELLGRDTPPVLSAAQRDLLARSTAPDVVYEALSNALS